jgi:hypothetical protein
MAVAQAISSSPGLGAAAAAYYVDGASAQASDKNPGTEALPWKTIQHAAAALQAGDTVYIKAATYRGDVRPARSGRASGWITYSAYPGEEQRAVIEGGVFRIEQKSYIKVSGLKIQHVAGEGILAIGPGANLVISGNCTYDTSESGIAIWGVRWRSDPGEYDFKAVTNVIVENNTIEMACDGGYNEQLDIANGVDCFEVRNNILKNGTNAIYGGEGIDIKEGASNGKVWGNEIFNIRRYGIYVEAGASDPAYYRIRPALLTNIEVFNNVVHDNDDHGIGITSEGRGNIDGIKVYNNLVYGNGADGILLYHYPGAVNSISNISIFHNTVYSNATRLTYSGGIAADHDIAQNVVIRSNIVYGNPGFQIKTDLNPRAIVDHNLTNPITGAEPGTAGKRL